MYLNIVLSKCLISVYFLSIYSKFVCLWNKVVNWIKRVSCHSATQQMVYDKISARSRLVSDEAQDDSGYLAVH